MDQTIFINKINDAKTVTFVRLPNNDITFYFSEFSYNPPNDPITLTKAQVKEIIQPLLDSGVLGVDTTTNTIYSKL